MALESRSSVKRLFAAILVLLGLHYVFIARYGEPYPAVTMPAFAGTNAEPDGSSRWVTVIARVRFADGSTAELLPRELLAEAPTSHRMSIMRRQFDVPPEPPAHPPAPSFGRELRRRLFPIERIRYERRFVQYTRPETQEWLRRRLGALYPHREPALVTFVWSEQSARLVDGSLQRARETIGEYTVPLDETAR